MVVSLDEVNWEEAGSELHWAVLVQLASGKPVRKGALVEVFEKVWKLKQEAKFFHVEKNTLLMQFKNKEDQERVLDGGPWTLEGDTILFQKWGRA